MRPTLIELPYPAKILWPNGRGHWAVKSKAFKQHKEWARLAMLGKFPRAENVSPVTGKINWKVTFHPKTRHPVDDDNARASLKAYQDGFALAFGIDDKIFNAPSVTFGETIKGGLIRVEFL